MCVGIAFIVWIVLAKKPEWLRYLLPITLFSNLTFSFVYIKIQSTNFGDWINTKSFEFFDKPFYSGRSTLWNSILIEIKEKQFFGFGLGTRAKDITSTHLSAHNQYLQLLIEGGAVGLVLFLILLLSIWKLLIKEIDNFTTQISICFFIAILVYENFEMTLFQNNYSIAMLQWLIITIGVSISRNNSPSKNPDTMKRRSFSNE